MYDDAKIAVVMTVDIAWNNLPAGNIFGFLLWAFWLFTACS